jgi:ABC-type multidrug transport system ATPase subunit
LLYVNGVPIDAQQFRRVSAYVEQEDALIGSLTVSETLDFAARLSPPSTSKTERLRRINTLLAAFGLSDLANDLIGTTIKKGVSGGQKRRVSVAAQLVTGPRLLFLDEPTSGLDSAAAFEVISFLKSVAQKYRVGFPRPEYRRTC